MIDKRQLKELGWSKQLINEVTRISDEMSEYKFEPGAIEDVTEMFSSHSADSIFFEAPNVDASTKIELHQEIPKSKHY